MAFQSFIIKRNINVPPLLVSNGTEEYFSKYWGECYIDSCDLDTINYRNDILQKFIKHNYQFIYENKNSDIIISILLRNDNGRNRVYYSINDANFVFDPDNSYLLYFQVIKRNQLIKSGMVIQFYFGMRNIRARHQWLPQGYDTVYTIRLKKHKAKDQYKFISKSIELPDWYNFTPPIPSREYKDVMNDFSEVPTVEEQAIENVQWVDNLFKNDPQKEEHLNYFLHKRGLDRFRFRKEYDRGYPHEMFTGFTNKSDWKPVYMYINDERFILDHTKKVKVPKGHYALYYSPQDRVYGIRYVKPVWIPRQEEDDSDGENEPNPAVRKYIYLKQLDIDGRMEPQLIDIFTKDHFFLQRIWYNNHDIGRKRDISVSYDEMKQNWEMRRNNFMNGNGNWRGHWENNKDNEWQNRRRYDDDLNLDDYDYQ